MPPIGAVRGLRPQSCLPPKEARLIAKINRGFTDAWWDHYDMLVAKRQQGVLSSAELRELIRLTDQIESREAKRLEALVELAKFQDRSLSEVITALGLSGRSDG